jgi:hypothetical protein
MKRRRPDLRENSGNTVSNHTGADGKFFAKESMAFFNIMVVHLRGLTQKNETVPVTLSI